MPETRSAGGCPWRGALFRCVGRALGKRANRSSRLALVTAGLAGLAAQALDEPTPLFRPEIPVTSLLPDNGGETAAPGSRSPVTTSLPTITRAAGEAGRVVGSAGDLNGDGLDDPRIGAPQAQLAAGETFVVFGRASFPALFELGSQVARSPMTA